MKQILIRCFYDSRNTARYLSTLFLYSSGKFSSPKRSRLLQEKGKISHVVVLFDDFFRIIFFFHISLLDSSHEITDQFYFSKIIAKGVNKENWKGIFDLKISNSEKKDLLLEIFELLKQNYQGNSYELRDCVSQIARIDLTLAIDLWKALMLENPAIHHTTCDFASSFMNSLEEAIGELKVYEIVLKDNKLKKSIYGEAGVLQLSPLHMIKHLISINDLETANEILQLIDGNPYLRNSWYDILDGIIPAANTTISENAFDLLSMWIKKVDNCEELAKLKLKMIDFLDEEDDDMVAAGPLIRDGNRNKKVRNRTKRLVEQEEITSQIKAGTIVKHKKFGTGRVKSIHPSLIVITFDNVDRTFSVPYVFDHGLLSLDN